MAILIWIGALVVLLVGALILNGVSQSLDGRDTIFIHFGWVTLILLVGGARFPFWGWTSTGWVLGVAAAWSIVPPLASRLLGGGAPPRQMYFGDDPPGDAEDRARPDDELGEKKSIHQDSIAVADRRTINEDRARPDDELRKHRSIHQDRIALTVSRSIDMDTPNKHTTVARMDIPGSGGAVFDIVVSTVVVFFVAVAISNLVDYEFVPLYAIIFSVLWLLIVATSIKWGILDERGPRQFIKDRLANLSAHRFVEFIPQHGDDLTVRFGFTLLGREFNHLQIPRAKLTSVGWRSGQTTVLAGHDMNDWHVDVCYNSASARRQEDVYVVGPDGPKHEAAALGASLVDFFRSAGIELHPTKNECEFTTRKQDDANAKSSDL